MTNELTKYLDPKVLSKITRLDLQARFVVEGFIAGMHRSPFHGLSVEFASHREYSPGDDIKHIDWKVQARTDRFYIKQYEEETNLKATFLIDASESMLYPGSPDGKGVETEGLSKYHYACAVGASLAFLLLRQQDAAGLAVFDESIRSHLLPSSNPNQIKSFVHALDVQAPKAKTSLEDICHNLAEKLPRRGLVCLISDLFIDDLAGLVRGLQHFRHYDHEVMILHVMDHDELTFPFEGNTLFRGLEQAGRLTVEPRTLRDGYLEVVGNFLREVQRICASHRVDYKLVSTADHLDAALCAFLAARAAAVRKAGSRR